MDGLQADERGSGARDLVAPCADCLPVLPGLRVYASVRRAFESSASVDEPNVSDACSGRRLKRDKQPGGIGGGVVYIRVRVDLPQFQHVAAVRPLCLRAVRQAQSSTAESPAHPAGAVGRIEGSGVGAEGRLRSHLIANAPFCVGKTLFECGKVYERHGRDS